MNLPPTNLTLQQVQDKLSGLHFSKEVLSKGEREILALAESLLCYIKVQETRITIMEQDKAIMEHKNE